MAIAVRCKSCGCGFRTGDQNRGKTFPCTRCGADLLVDGKQVPDFDVFVSHSSKDKQTADAVVATLEAGGVRCWVAPRDIAPGARWGASIIEAISTSRIMVLIYSGHSNMSEQVLREVERAVSKSITVIPLRIDSTPMSKDMEYFISSSHWLDAMTPPLESHLNRLVRTVQRTIEEDDQSASGEAQGKASSAARTLSGSTAAIKPRHSTRKKLFLVAAVLYIIGVAALFLRPLRERASRFWALKDPTPPASVTRPTPTPARIPSPENRIITNTVDIKLVFIPAGEFMMGSPDNEPDRNPDETLHKVKITRPFYIGMYTVTRGQFAKFVDAEKYETDAEKAKVDHTWRKPGIEQGDNEPVVSVSWNDASKFIDWLNRNEKHLGRHYRLPTEAEWEYACRAGTSTRFNTGESEEALDKVGWYFANSGIGTHAVGGKYPNKWGLYDMHGNVYQWCSDYYAPYTGDAEDPHGPDVPDKPASRVARGGSWLNPPPYCRSANRLKYAADDWGNLIGFRCCMDVP